jgi:small subunit ribosomal protein S4
MRLNGPKVKLSRALGIALTPKAEIVMRNKPQPPGVAKQGRRRKVSDFKTQLLEKQRLRAQYNISERQLRNYYASVSRLSGDAGRLLVSTLERRLDAMVLRAGFAPTIYAAKQFVSHGHILVNGRRTNVRSYLLKPGDVFAVKASSRKMPVFEELSQSGGTDVTYLSVDRGQLSARLLRIPDREEIPVICETQTVVEYYSR